MAKRSSEQDALQFDQLLPYAIDCYNNGYYEKALTLFQIITIHIKVIPPSLWLACAACLAEIGHISECILIVQYIYKRPIGTELRLEALIVIISAILNDAMVNRNKEHLLQLETYLFELRSIDENNPLLFIGYVSFFMHTYALTLPAYLTEDYISNVTSHSLLARYYLARFMHTRGDISAANTIYEETLRSAEILCWDTGSVQFEHYKAIYHASLESLLICELFMYFSLKGSGEMCALGYVTLPEAEASDQLEDPRIMHLSTGLEVQLARLRTKIRSHYAKLMEKGLVLAHDLVVCTALATQSNDILIQHASGSISPLSIIPIMHLSRFSYSNVRDLLSTIVSMLSYTVIINNQSNAEHVPKINIKYIKILDHPGYRGAPNDNRHKIMRGSGLSCVSSGDADELTSCLTPFLPLTQDVLLTIVREGLFEDSFGNRFVSIFPELFYNVSLIAFRALDLSSAFLFLCVSVYSSIARFLLLGGDPNLCLSDVKSVKERLIKIENLIRLLCNAPDILELRDDIMTYLLYAPLDTCYALCYYYRHRGLTKIALKLAIALSHIYFSPKLSIFIVDMLREEGVAPVIQLIYLFGPRASAVLNTQGPDFRTIWNAETLTSVHPRLLAYLAIILDPMDSSESIYVYQKALSTTIKAQEKNKISQLFCETAMIYLITVKACYYVTQKYLIKNLYANFKNDVSLFKRIAQDNDDILRFLTKVMTGLKEKISSYETTIDYYYKYIDSKVYARYPLFDYSPIIFNLKVCLTNLMSAKAALCAINNQAINSMVCILTHISVPASCDRRLYLSHNFMIGCMSIAQNSVSAVSTLEGTLLSGLLMRIVPSTGNDDFSRLLLPILEHVNQKYLDVFDMYQSIAARTGLKGENYPSVLSNEVEHIITDTHPVIPLSLLLYLIVSLYNSGEYVKCLTFLNTMLLQYPIPKYPLLSMIIAMILEAIISPMDERTIGRDVKLFQGALYKVAAEQQLTAEKECEWLSLNNLVTKPLQDNKVSLLAIRKAEKMCADLSAITDIPSNEMILQLSQEYTSAANGSAGIGMIRNKIMSSLAEHINTVSNLRSTFSTQIATLTESYKLTSNLFKLSMSDVELCTMYLNVLNNIIQEAAELTQNEPASIASESLLFNTPTYPWLSSTFPRFLSKLGASKSTFATFLPQDVDYNSLQLEAITSRYGVPTYVESFMRSYMSLYKFPLVKRISDSFKYYSKELKNIKHAEALLKRLKEIDKALNSTIISMQTILRSATSKVTEVKLDIYTIARQNEELAKRNREVLGLSEQSRHQYGERASKEPPGKLRAQNSIRTTTEMEVTEDKPWNIQNAEVGVGSEEHDSTHISSYNNFYEENNLLAPQMLLPMDDPHGDENDDI